MIRINLLPASDRKRRGRTRTTGSGSSQLFGAIVIIVLMAEVGGLYTWYSMLEDEARDARSKAVAAQQKVKSLEKFKTQFEALKAEREALESQQRVFAALEDSRTGPLESLQFLAYVLTKPDTQQTDEITAQEGTQRWNVGWDPSRVWITEFSQDDSGFAVIKGLARETVDAAEFLRRLETSVYFVIPDMLKLQPVPDEVFPERVVLTAFEVEAVLNFNKDGRFRMYEDAMPDALRRHLPKAKTPSKKKAKDAKGKGKKA